MQKIRSRKSDAIRHCGTKTHVSISRNNKLKIINESNGILIPDETENDIERVYCRACDSRIPTSGMYHSERHVNLQKHQCITEEYMNLIANEHRKKYENPVDAAICIYNRNMFTEATTLREIEVHLVKENTNATISALHAIIDWKLGRKSDCFLI